MPAIERFDCTYSLITALIQMNCRMSCNVLIFFRYIRKKHLRKRKDLQKRPVSTFSNFSKVYEKKCTTNSMIFLYAILFLSQCGIRQGFISQHCLLFMIEMFNKLSTEVMSSVPFRKHLIT